MIKRTPYPRLEGASGVIDVGSNYRNRLMKAGTTSTQKWNGFKIYMDLKSQAWTSRGGSLVMKIFYERMGSTKSILYN